MVLVLILFCSLYYFGHEAQRAQNSPMENIAFTGSLDVISLCLVMPN